MTNVWSPMMRRTVALAILVTLIALFWLTALRPLLGLALDRRSDITELSEQITRLDGLIARRSGLQQRLLGGKTQLTTVGGFWNGASPAAIAAAVQDRLREAVVAGGGQITSTSEAHEGAEYGFRKITVHFSIEGTLNTMVKTLAAIETSRPALFADNFTVVAQENATERKGPPILDLDLDVSGYSAAPGS
ncbi:MAG TPA: type II secretion system protein GspM [Stellaceae bacterium]|nr:type II secretion system protein GspM [Stellaceae bacterium]